MSSFVLRLMQSALLFGLCSTVVAAPLSDPTKPFDYIPVELPALEKNEPVILPREQVKWNLSAIRIGPRSRFAILNGQMVRTGEEIETAKVLEIKPSEVLLEYDNQTVIVTLLERDVKKNTR